ncbi:MAG TPA: VOC family protein [Gammaproteobacteria bacterium]|nr:VOC family protein [Gammaproteobacteria bacterium]
MKNTILALGACLALTAGAAHAGVTLNSARVAGKDAVALARFYEAAFGLKEVNRLTFPNGVEIFLNFGDTTEAAKANGAPQVVIMQGEPSQDPVAHLIFTVTDAAATVAAAKAAGGTADRAPQPFGNTGTVIGFVADPAGNRIELIQRPQR